MGTEDNKTLSQRSMQYLQTEYSDITGRLGKEYSHFLQKYPTLQKRKDFIASLYDAVSREGNSIAGVDSVYGYGASEWWIKVMLIELFTFVGAMDSVTTFQVKALASRIRKTYHYITPDELTYFFYAFSLGDYGRMYSGRTVNPQDVLIALKEFSEQLFESRLEYEKKKAEEKQEKEREDSRRNAVSFDQWKKIRNLGDDYQNPLLRAVSEINKHKK